MADFSIIKNGSTIFTIDSQKAAWAERDRRVKDGEEVDIVAMWKCGCFLEGFTTYVGHVVEEKDWNLGFNEDVDAHQTVRLHHYPVVPYTPKYLTVRIESAHYFVIQDILIDQRSHFAHGQGVSAAHFCPVMYPYSHLELPEVRPNEKLTLVARNTDSSRRTLSATFRGSTKEVHPAHYRRKWKVTSKCAGHHRRTLDALTRKANGDHSANGK